MTLSGRTVVIITPVWMQGDGVGHDVEGMARALLGAGCTVHVYAPMHYAPGYEYWRVDASLIRSLLDEPSTILIYHHSIHSPETEALLRNAKTDIKVMRYHNVTPPEFFINYNEQWVENCLEGRLATPRVAKLCTHFTTPSLYDARDLVHAGVHPDRIFYLPYFHKLHEFDEVEPNQVILNDLNDDKFHVVFLGRRVPNKGHLHLIRTIAAYKRNHDDAVVLHLAGSIDSTLGKYNEEIEQEIVALGVQTQVRLYDKLSFPEIVALYKGSDAFLCMSEHEGFCIPVIEAEYCGLPVVAYYKRGVPEALGPTQPWFTSLDYDNYAAELRKIRIDAVHAHTLGAAASASVRERFDIQGIKDRFLGWIKRLDARSHLPAAVVRRDRPKVAFVVQRYGKEVAGGAETFARMYAERCSAFFDITVLTSTSKTLDWDSDIPLHADAKQPSLHIVRFPPAKYRDDHEFSVACNKANEGKLDFDDWLLVSGPNAPEMGEFLDKHAREFDAIVNWTYLFSNVKYTTDQSGIAPLISIPFFHDEGFLYYPDHARIASKFDAYIYQTEAERSLGANLKDVPQKPYIVLGAGIDEQTSETVLSAKDSQPPISSPYIIYIGRVERAKNLDKLFNDFIRYKRDNPSDLKLVIVGRARDCEIPDNPDFIETGFISEYEKFIWLKHAIALINPSIWESFSLVLIESWAMGRPVLVNGRCAATSGQVSSSGGGLVYENYSQFAWSLSVLSRELALASELGENGRSFYQKHYKWNTLAPNFVAFVKKVIEDFSLSNQIRSLGGEGVLPVN